MTDAYRDPIEHAAALLDAQDVRCRRDDLLDAAAARVTWANGLRRADLTTVADMLYEAAAGLVSEQNQIAFTHIDVMKNE